MAKSTSFSLKDQIFNKNSIQAISERIVKSYPGFNSKLFISSVFDSSWKEREFKERMKHVSSSLHTTLNKPYPKCVDILLETNSHLPNQFVNIIFPTFIEQYGQDHLLLSMNALKQMTSKSSSEFAVRPFIVKYGEEAMKIIYTWTKDKDEHVRRLACEGCRPKLPWSSPLPQFIKDPSPILPILEQLKNDNALYVQKSVGNCLNDISKNHPELVIKICKDWKQQQENKESLKDGKDTINQIAKRGCRTLLKQGDQDALQLFGLGQKDNISVDHFKITNHKEIYIGGQIEFQFEIFDLSRKQNKNQNKQVKEEQEEQEQENELVEKLEIRPRRSARLNKVKVIKEEIKEDKNGSQINQVRLRSNSKKQNKVEQKENEKDEDEEEEQSKDKKIKQIRQRSNSAKSNKQQQQESEEEEEETEGQSQSKQAQKRSNSKKQKKQYEENEDEEEEEEEEEVDNREQGLRIEYQINYLKSNHTHSSKIFMLKNNYVIKGTKDTIKGTQKMQQLSTRKHYPGEHFISIIVNGTVKAKTAFDLKQQKKE